MFQHIQAKLLEVETFYAESSLPFDREWTEISLKEAWLKSVKEGEGDIAALIKQLDDGMSLPTALLKKEDRVQRFRLQLFKFWPNTELRDTWRSYLNSAAVGSVNILALSICMRILEQTVE